MLTDTINLLSGALGQLATAFDEGAEGGRGARDGLNFSQHRTQQGSSAYPPPAYQQGSSAYQQGSSAYTQGSSAYPPPAYQQGSSAYQLSASSPAPRARFAAALPPPAHVLPQPQGVIHIHSPHTMHQQARGPPAANNKPEQARAGATLAQRRWVKPHWN